VIKGVDRVDEMQGTQLEDREQVSIIIPAYNEESRIGKTLSSLRNEEWIREVIVVDDGSKDQTSGEAKKWTKHVIKLPRNGGKALAIEKGCQYASSPILLFLDADLEHSAALAKMLVQPIWLEQAEMTIAIFPPSVNGGFGMVKDFASWGIYKKTGRKLQAPLCGQRALKKDVLEACYQGDKGFGIEVGLALDFLSSGYRVQEIEVGFTHRETGRRLSGFYHRMKQGVSVCQSLISRR
jgi:glycosyltransferase involved in cell wall biosynthesis